MIGTVKDAIIARRGKEAKNIGKVVAAAAPYPGVLRPARRADPLPVAGSRRVLGTGGMTTFPASGEARGRRSVLTRPFARRGRPLD